jgi:hypothetical protein
MFLRGLLFQWAGVKQQSLTQLLFKYKIVCNAIYNIHFVL